jgi:hypothetical protein
MSKLTVNVGKTKYMVLNSSNLNELKMDGTNLERVTTIKYLGIMINENMTFKQNTELVIRKISKKVYFLTRMKKMIGRKNKIFFYKTLIQPHLDYCSSILFLSCDQELKRIQKICNRALRAILLRDWMVNVHQMLLDTDILD